MSGVLSGTDVGLTEGEFGGGVVVWLTGTTLEVERVDMVCDGGGNRWLVVVAAVRSLAKARVL